MPARARSSCASSTSRTAVPADRLALRPPAANRHQVDRKADLVLLARLQRPDADHLALQLLAAFVGDRNHHAVLAALVALGRANQSVHSHRRHLFCLRFGIRGRIEPQMVLATRTYVRALQHYGFAVRTY